MLTNLENVMNLYNPDERNPLILSELVLAVLTSAAGILLLTALLGAVHCWS